MLTGDSVLLRGPGVAARRNNVENSKATLRPSGVLPSSTNKAAAAIALPTILTTNPLAPRWRMDSSNPEETPDGYRDQFFQYSMNFTIAANIFAQGLFIILDRDADFILRQIEAQAYIPGIPNGANGAYRIRDSFGNPLSDDLVLQEVQGPMFPDLWLPGGSRVFLDYDNTQQAFSQQIAVILRGCKRYKVR